MADKYQPWVAYCTNGFETSTGHYWTTSAYQHQATSELNKDKILDLIDTIPVRGENHVFTIVDCGAADGSVSIPLFREAIGRVRKKHGDIPVHVVYEDQPANDFNSLFKRIFGVIPVPKTYLKDFSDVFVSATAATFFGPIVPPDSADFMCSFQAVQYLSKPATKYQDSFHRFPYGTPEECRLEAAQAAEDWENFLLYRAKELKTGGILVVTTPADDPQCRVKGLRHDVEDAEKALVNVWRRMRDEGKITQEEYFDTNCHRCSRHVEEFEAPFQGNKSSVTKAGLQLIGVELGYVPCIATLEWKKKLERDGVDDRKTWAKAVVGQFQQWSYWQIVRALSDSRSSEEKEALMKEYYDRLEQEAMEIGPEKYNNNILLAFVFVRKL